MNPQLTPLAVALQGLGFGTHLTALQGILVVEPVLPPPVGKLLAGGLASRPRRRSRRLLRPVAPAVLIQPDQDDEELTLQLLGML